MRIETALKILEKYRKVEKYNKTYFVGNKTNILKIFPNRLEKELRTTESEIDDFVICVEINDNSKFGFRNEFPKTLKEAIKHLED